MKIRTGFVSNSSSTSFTITNTSKEVKTLLDFVKENIHLVDEFNEQYNWHNYTHEQAIESVKQYPDYAHFEPGESKECVFGDEHGTVLGAIYDYILRDGGESKSFKWKFKEFYR